MDNTIIKNDELKLKERISNIIEGIIKELSSSSSISKENFDLQASLNNLEQIKIEIRNLIRHNKRRTIFNFSKLLFSKDLRRNVSYFEILIRIEKISNLSVKSSILIINLWNQEVHFSDIKHENYILGLSETLISILKELINLIFDESSKLSEKLLKDSFAFNQAILNFSKELNDLIIKATNIEEIHYFLKNWSTLLTIIKNFEFILCEIDEICNLIIYIKTGKMN